MKAAKVVAALCLFMVANVAASGRTSVYAVIEKVVFEPNETNAERIHLWGAFSFAGITLLGETTGPRLLGSKPLRGYLYFSLPPAGGDHIKLVRTEWADLKSMAGTGQAVSFGQWSDLGATSPGPSGEIYVSVPNVRGGIMGARLTLLGQSAPGASPTPWVTNTGLVKLRAEGSHAALVKQLRDALKETR
jgi:hypothetical protein